MTAALRLFGVVVALAVGALLAQCEGECAVPGAPPLDPARGRRHAGRASGLRDDPRVQHAEPHARARDRYDLGFLVRAVPAATYAHDATADVNRHDGARPAVKRLHEGRGRLLQAAEDATGRSTLTSLQRVAYWRAEGR